MTKEELKKALYNTCKKTETDSGIEVSYLFDDQATVIQEMFIKHTSHLTAENTRLREAIQYYFDVLEEVRGDTWKDRPDHVLKKMIDAMNKQPSPKSDKS